MKYQFADNPTFMQHEAMLRQLHALIAAGRGEEQEADALREEMDESWLKLSAAEMTRIDGLSADLYMLSGDETIGMPDRTKGQFQNDLTQAVGTNRWTLVLELLRIRPHILPEWVVAYYRARAYGELGHIETSIAFAELAYARFELVSHSSQVTRDDILYELLMLLSRSGRQVEATRRAEARVSASEAPADLQLLYAYFLFLTTQNQREPELHNSLRRVLAIVHQLRGSVEYQTLGPRELSFSHLIAGLCHRALDERTEADAEFSDAVKTWSGASELLQEALSPPPGGMSSPTERLNSGPPPMSYSLIRQQLARTNHPFATVA